MDREQKDEVVVRPEGVASIRPGEGAAVDRPKEKAAVLKVKASIKAGAMFPTHW